MTIRSKKIVLVATALGLSIALAAVQASETTAHGASHGDSHGGHGGHVDPSIGQPGDASKVSRTIQISMTDNQYSPASIEVEPGEVVRFVVRNDGQLVHEFNLANASMHKAHQGEMLAMMRSGALTPTRVDHSKTHDGGMMHDDPNSVLLEPGQAAELIWKFGTSKDIEFACNVPGHYQAGMKGSVHIH